MLTAHVFGGGLIFPPMLALAEASLLIPVVRIYLDEEFSVRSLGPLRLPDEHREFHRILRFYGFVVELVLKRP